jgi:hypothetical protein
MRTLTQEAWYEVRTAVNNREPLFRRRQVIAIFCQVLGEARRRFSFEMRGFRLEEEWLSFYIKPADGLQLPAIMQWLKQTFAVRFNRGTGRTGHVWGDRYWSRVLEGEPPEEAGEVDWVAVDVAAETGELPFGTRPLDGVSPFPNPEAHLWYARLLKKQTPMSWGQVLPAGDKSCPRRGSQRARNNERLSPSHRPTLFRVLLLASAGARLNTAGAILGTNDTASRFGRNAKDNHGG